MEVVVPFVSQAQEGYMHEHPEILGKSALHEWDEATKGKSLPKRKSMYRHAYNTRKKEGIEHRAMGGPVMPGGNYMVGEKGPEIFHPFSPGTIMTHGTPVVRKMTGGF
jgi:hypothetical protein